MPGDTETEGQIEMNKCRGLFIVFEGLDRAGKSTQVNMLESFLKNMGKNTELMKFPDRSTLCGKIINDLLQDRTLNLEDEAFHTLFCTNRWEKKLDIIDKLKKGSNLVVDRYAYSGVAYSTAKGLDISWTKNGDVGLPRPDIVFYMDLDPEIAAQRAGYGEERYAFEIFKIYCFKLILIPF